MPLDHQENREPTIFNSLLILLFVGISLFVALLYRQNDLSLLAILILTVVGAAKAWSAMSGDRIRSDSTIDSRRVFPEETVTLATTVENGKWLPVWLRIMWSFQGALYPVGGQGNIIQQQAAVMWHQTVEFRHNFVASRRGVYQVGPPRIRTSDFLGFFKKDLSARSIAWIIVYPQLVSLKPVAIRRRDLFGVPGAKTPIKDPVYILGTREYQPSRPSRHIHWKASARHLRLQEKIFEPSEQEKVLLTLEVGSFEKDFQRNGFERTLEVVASLAVRFDDLGYAVSFIANGTLKGGDSAEIPLSRGPRQVSAILEVLARIQATPGDTLTKNIQKFLGSQRGISCVHFCYEEDSSLTEMEKFFHKQQIPVSFLVYHHGQNTRPFKGSNRYSIAEICLDRSRKS